MHLAATDILDLVSQDCDDILVSPVARHRMRMLVSAYGAALQPYYYEMRLGRAASGVDLLVAVTRHQREAVATTLAATASRKHEPTWEAVAKFCELWSRPATGLDERIPFITLEFDGVDAPEDRAPSLAICLERDYVRSPQEGGRTEHRATLEALLPALDELGDARLPRSYRTAITKCLELLPAGGRFIHLSLMTARDPVQVKLYGFVPRSQLLEYLRGLGWSDDPELHELLERGFPECRVGDGVYVDLDLDQLEGRLGLVFSQQQLERSIESSPGREHLLDYCVANQLCSQRERDALARWGGDHVRDAPDGRPMHVSRWLDVKLVRGTDRSLTAKAYLGFHVRRKGLWG